MNKITLKKSIKIIDDEYVIKKKTSDVDKTYNYLLSRSFNYFPRIIKEDNGYIYYEYIVDVSEPAEQKMLDLIYLLSLLHEKTTFYKEIDIEYYKYIYESISNDISSTYNYYNQLMDNIEQIKYMSPADYLIARNISVIYDSLAFSHENINLWYKMVKDSRKIRMVTVHNNLSLDHYIKGNKPYFISWDKSTNDSPIIDLVSLYKHNYLDFDFIEILDIYLKKYPLTKEELTLFLVLIAIPDKIKNSKTTYERVLTIRRLIDYLYKSKELLEKYSVKEKE